MRWTWQLVRDALEHALRSHPGVKASAPELEKQVLAGELTPALAARQILDTFLAAPPSPWAREHPLRRKLDPPLGVLGLGPRARPFVPIVQRVLRLGPRAPARSRRT